MCRNDKYTEHGIKALDGFGSELYRLDPEFVVPIPESLGSRGVLVEPASVVAKAWEHVDRIGARALWEPRRVLITGGGPVGLLAAMIGVQRGLEVHVYDRNTDGPKPALIRDLGATHHAGSMDDLGGGFDIVLECTGAAAVVACVTPQVAANGIACLLGVSSTGEIEEIDVGKRNLDIVLGNRVVFGSVNANRRHYRSAVAALSHADQAWLDRLITRRVRLDDWRDAFESRKGDVKTIVLFDRD